MEEKQEVSQRILDIATKRLQHYGYQKTTMADIAKDLSMSTGNLYRFFPSKLDIAQEITNKIKMHEQSFLSSIAHQNISATDRIHKFFYRIFKDTFEKIESDDKFAELILIIKRERPEYAESILDQERELLLKIYQDGIDEGVFKVFDDPKLVLRSFQHALTRYRYSQLYTKAEFETLSFELDNVIDLLIRGISN